MGGVGRNSRKNRIGEDEKTGRKEYKDLARDGAGLKGGWVSLGVREGERTQLREGGGNRETEGGSCELH